jgi:hypothetical protein
VRGTHFIDLSGVTGVLVSFRGGFLTDSLLRLWLSSLSLSPRSLLSPLSLADPLSVLARLSMTSPDEGLASSSSLILTFSSRRPLCALHVRMRKYHCTLREKRASAHTHFFGHAWAQAKDGCSSRATHGTTPRNSIEPARDVWCVRFLANHAGW